MRFIQTIFFLFILGLVEVSGQDVFKPGQIIKLNGDTLSGFVSYWNWAEDPSSVKFMESENGGATIFNASELKAFLVDSEIYIGATVDIEDSAGPNASYDREPKLTTKTLFLQAIVFGPKSLLYCKYLGGRQYFYIKNSEGKFELLVYKEYMIENKRNVNSVNESSVAGWGYGGDLKAENKKYIGQLNYYLQDCQGISKRLERTEYQKKSLEAVFEFYYRTTGTVLDFKKEEKKLKAYFGILAGATNTSIEFKPYSAFSDRYLYLTDFSNSIFPAGGVYLEVFFPRILRHWSVNAEWTISNYKFKGTYEVYVDENDHRTSQVEFGFRDTRITALVRYNFLLGSVAPYVGAGYLMAYSRLGTNKVHTEQVYFSPVVVTENEAVVRVRQSQRFLVFNVGSRIGRFSVDGRYEIGQGVYSKNADGDLKRVTFLVGYRLFTEKGDY